MGFLDKLKNMFTKVDETVNTPPPPVSTDGNDQANNDALGNNTPASQEPASIGGVSTPPTTDPGMTAPAPGVTPPSTSTTPPNDLPQ